MKSCSTQLLPKNTVLFSSRAPIGYVAIAANEVCTNQGFKSVVPNDNTDPLFLYYLLKYNKDKIEGMGSGTTFKEISGNTMKNIVVSVPIDKKMQERISSVLGSIDDKIEENERINNNLSPNLCKAQIAAKQRKQIPRPVECMHTNGKVSVRGGNEKTTEQFSNLLAA